MSMISRSMRYNLRYLQDNPLGEIAGSLGDLGTLLPLMTALAAAGAINLNSTLMFSGIFNIVTGVIFGVPIAVQPMKAVASISLARKMSLCETVGAGLSVGFIVGFLSLTGLLSRAGRIVPIPIVKGIQLGAGLSLILNAGSMLKGLPWVSSGQNNLCFAVGMTVMLFGTSRWHRYPFALVAFVIGMAGAWLTHPTVPRIGIQVPQVMMPLWNDIKSGFLTAGIGQLPLTILNSVVAVNHLAADLFPRRPIPSFTELGMSVCIMNVTGGLFGSMPVCHGSGGLAAQYRFGARSGSSVIFLGIVKLLLGSFVGDPLVDWLKQFPAAILGVMVFAAGIELSAAAQSLNTAAHGIQIDNLVDMEAKERWTMMMITAGALVAFRNAFIGFAMGYTYLLSLILQERLKSAWTNTSRRFVWRRANTGLDESAGLLT